MKFKKGDRISLTKLGVTQYSSYKATDVFVVIEVHSRGNDNSDLVSVKGGQVFYCMFTQLAEPDTPETIHQRLCAKVVQLYERQEWVQSGKPEAIFSIRPPAPSAESRDGTGEGTTSESSLTGIVTALAVGTSNPPTFPIDELIRQYRSYRNPQYPNFGLSPSQINPISGFGRTTSR